MNTKSKPVEIIGVDTERMEKDSTFKEAYAIYINLSDRPDSIWENYLSKWNNALLHMKRDMKVVGDKLRLVFVYGDDIQGFIEYARNLVKWVNDRVEEYNKKAELEEVKRQTIQNIEQKKEDEIRQRLRDLQSWPIRAKTEVTLDELFSAYAADEDMADARFGNKIIEITGLVDKVEIQDKIDIHNIILNRGQKRLPLNVRCIFGKGQTDKLKRLTKGKTVTVRGKFISSIVEFRMTDCVLVR